MVIIYSVEHTDLIKLCLGVRKRAVRVTKDKGSWVYLSGRCYQTVKGTAM